MNNPIKHPCPRVLFPVAAALICGCSHSVLFTSDTKIGLDISQSGSQAPEAAFGYKRSAVVIMPVRGTNSATGVDASDTNDCYSVLADVSLSWRWTVPLLSSNTNTGIHIGEIMATGAAARSLATNQTLGELFGRTILRIHDGPRTNAPSAGTGSNHSDPDTNTPPAGTVNKS
jgi:hypothetical protein